MIDCQLTGILRKVFAQMRSSAENVLAEWQKARLATVHAGRKDYGVGRDDVTVLSYYWGATADSPDTQFYRMEVAFRETWLHCGMLHSVIVTDCPTKEVECFAENFPNVEIQIEPTLVPGRLFTMSADMNGRLFTRFKTPYVLIIQNDGYPIRTGMEDFVGKYDFIGAPYIGLQWWKQLISYVTNYRVQNGGFSLRSRAICEAAAYYWNEKYHKLGDCIESAEDIFYTSTLIKKERKYRRTFRLATSKESLAFSWDALVPIPQPDKLPFGFHRDISLSLLNI